ncbi:MAG: hypothetical protein HKN47_22380 [Pirellulaceae bacterium]|nr:hypothetical protein [Pirellulaceae bacterium]
MNPETLREVAAVREVEWAKQSDEVSILLHQPELQSSQLQGAWKLIHDRFLCDPERTDRPVRFAANDLTIHSRSGAMTLRDVGAWLRPSGNSVEAAVQCIPANYQLDSPVTVKVNRDRETGTPKTKWVLDTGRTPLPCSALADYLPALDALGSEAEFIGTMRWQSDANEWIVDLSGATFDKVALDRLFEKQSHRLSGKATIHLDRCRIDPSQRHSDIVGSIRAIDGRIGRSLLLSAQQHLGFEVRFPDGVDDVPYDLLAVAFNINSTQMELDGICHSVPGFNNLEADTALCLDGIPMVRSTDTDLDALAVVTAIAPSHSVMVPLSNQTGWLTNIFVPPSRPLPGAQSRIRSATRWQGGPTIEQPESGTRY